ncbi:MAG TPA: methyltransferase domain-containing protein [Actinomycetota bacterium]|jgi:2-polyprenyl-3-methyl-5-hydroxy-6-metoxy-1,4-benzoquinol methylase|nr:methyltransferase domain-containing protein [Actinomycetota bacterium]
MSDSPISAGTAERTIPLAQRLFRSAIAALDLYALYLGDRLGLYRALAESGPATSGELAGLTGTNERYVREWLEHQAVSGVLTVDDPAADALSRRYSLPAEHIEVLVDQDSLNYEAHKGIDIVRGARRLPDLVEAFRTGSGLPPLPWEPEGRAEFNRARFKQLLGTQWLPAIPEVHARLRSNPPARVADLGCGTGWSSVAMAQAYPKAIVEGFDLDEAAIAEARKHAVETGVDGRVRFQAHDVAELAGSESYDLITVFEALHDMARPVDVLKTMRALVAVGGSVIVADERVGERFALPAEDQEVYVYGWSVVDCLSASMGDPPFAQTGAVMRPDTLRRYALEAGFGHVEVLPIEDRQWRFYLLKP